jgi:hypothetical protein
MRLKQDQTFYELIAKEYNTPYIDEYDALHFPEFCHYRFLHLVEIMMIVSAPL